MPDQIIHTWNTWDVVSLANLLTIAKEKAPGTPLEELEIFAHNREIDHGCGPDWKIMLRKPGPLLKAFRNRVKNNHHPAKT